MRLLRGVCVFLLSTVCAAQLLEIQQQEYVKSREEGTYLCVVSTCGHTLTGTRIHVNVETTVLSEAEPYTLIVSVVVLGLVVCVLLWGIWRSSQKREVKRCDHRPLSTQPDDGLTYTAGELQSSSGSTTARLRRDRDSYTKVASTARLRMRPRNPFVHKGLVLISLRMRDPALNRHNASINVPRSEEMFVFSSVCLLRENKIPAHFG
uniref:Uncharacterized protein n=1 Tax=Knipowitschia caucasica TaxID=637954 RepID=A0AAV2J9F0_KNICA